ncbi:hypothetical protein [Prosthecochloris sp.]|uniref:hypothetical protein n=1 Tax=Prosthecochloris sp. TaxID=290513 RepID=UPI0025CCCAA2|nr:hypothetical protein [Prosthecochloris sp.]
MDFFLDLTWWGLLSCALAAAIVPAFLQKIRITVLTATALFCLAMITAMYFITGMVSAIAGSALTLFAGLTALLVTLVISGINTMLKKRYR